MKNKESYCRYCNKHFKGTLEQHIREYHSYMPGFNGFIMVID